MSEISYVSPIDAGETTSVTSRYSYDGTDYVRKHLGWDYAAPEGTEIRAITGGKIVWIGDNTKTVIKDGITTVEGFGKTVIIEHTDGTQSTATSNDGSLYAHMSSFAFLNLGDTVNAGDVIGYVGNTGGSRGNHLHIELKTAIGIDAIKSSNQGQDPEGTYAKIGVVGETIDPILTTLVNVLTPENCGEVCVEIATKNNICDFSAAELLSLQEAHNALRGVVVEQLSEYELLLNESFYDIADRLIANGTIDSLQDLIDINPDILDFDLLEIGQKLNIPTGEELSLGEVALNYLKDFGTMVVDSISQTLSNARNALASLLELLRKDPLVLDLNGDGIALTSAENSTVFFDMDGDGDVEATGWVEGAGDDAFLVVDKNENGNVDDISELFGNDSETGFEELSKYDSNVDGVINSYDSQFNLLKVWDDANNNAVVDAGELTSLGENGVEGISLNTYSTSFVARNNNGNLVTEQSLIEMSDGSTREVNEVFFATDNFNTNNPNADDSLGVDFELDIRTAVLPFSRGYGELHSWQVAMSLDSELLDMGIELANNTIKPQFAEKFLAVA